MKAMVHRPVVPLGGSATLTEEVDHYTHHLGNQLAVLSMRIEMRAAASKQRVARAMARMADQEEYNCYLGWHRFVDGVCPECLTVEPKP